MSQDPLGLGDGRGRRLDVVEAPEVSDCDARLVAERKCLHIGSNDWSVGVCRQLRGRGVHPHPDGFPAEMRREAAAAAADIEHRSRQLLCDLFADVLR